jgi:Zn-dependent oligopeptidase
MWPVWISRVDLDMHTADAPDLDRLMRECFAPVKPPYPEGTFILAGFGHVFAGYDAGWYGYQWAEVIR